MHISPAPEEAFAALLEYCSRQEWAGHDPYDALNSSLLYSLPGGRSRMVQIGFTQLLKRSPLNFREILSIPQTQNPKALALALSATLRIERVGVMNGTELSAYLLKAIIRLRSPHERHWCWGYSFPWRTRTRLIPKGAPNLVCTTFVANAILDLWDVTRSPNLLSMAASAADYIARDLYFEESAAIASFAYPSAKERSKIHNANLLAAALLARVHLHRPNDVLLRRALAAAHYSAACQRADGSWVYGEAATQQWIDNFHTGYNLTALRSIARSLDTTEFDGYIAKGFKFYVAHFVREDGVARYYHNRTYPIDIHCVAQTILSLLEFSDMDSAGVARADAVYDWVMRHMWDRRGFFYYRVLPLVKIRTSYMRWSQAWMLFALASLVEHRHESSARAKETCR